MLRVLCFRVIERTLSEPHCQPRGQDIDACCIQWTRYLGTDVRRSFNEQRCTQYKHTHNLPRSVNNDIAISSLPNPMKVPSKQLRRPVLSDRLQSTNRYQRVVSSALASQFSCRLVPYSSVHIQLMMNLLDIAKARIYWMFPEAGIGWI